MAVPASDSETARGIYVRCTEAGVYLFQRYLPLLLRRQAPARPQPEHGGSYYRPGYPFDRWIDWSRDAETLCRFVRALTFPPFPSARTAYKGHELEICHPVWVSQDSKRWPAATVLELTPSWVTVATAEGLLSVKTMRLDGVELAAMNVLQRLGCSEGEALDGVSWTMSEAV
jgi:methionyl-tRNA formyltransferase